MAKYAIQCEECKVVHHGKMGDDCPCCGAIGKGKRIKINLTPWKKLLKLEE